MRRAILALVLAATMGGCIHRTSSHPMAPAFPVVTSPLPRGADAWVCEFRNGGGFQVCDAVVVNGETFTRIAFDAKVAENMSGYLRIDQPNGLVVYWRARMMA